MLACFTGCGSVFCPGGRACAELVIGEAAVAELDYRDYEAVAAHYGISEDGIGMRK